MLEPRPLSVVRDASTEGVLLQVIIGVVGRSHGAMVLAGRERVLAFGRRQDAYDRHQDAYDLHQDAFRPVQAWGSVDRPPPKTAGSRSATAFWKGPLIDRSLSSV